MSTHNTTALEKQQPNAIAQMKRLLESDALKKRFADVLKDRAPQFMASITNLMQQSPQLQKCKPESVLAAAFIAASLDLPIDRNLGYAWIVPYGDLAQFQMGYKGYIQLALRTNEYTGMNADVVNRAAVGKADEIGDRKIDWDKIDKTKPVAGYVFAWKMRNGFSKVVFWTRAETEEHARRYSKAYQRDLKQNKKDSPWSTDFDKMGIKTVIRNGLSKWGYLSVEHRGILEFALAHDQSAQSDIDAEIDYIDRAESKQIEAADEDAELITEDQRRELFALASEVECPTDRLSQILTTMGFAGLFAVSVERLDDVREAVTNWRDDNAGVDEHAELAKESDDVAQENDEKLATYKKQRDQIEMLRVELIDLGAEAMEIGETLSAEVDAGTIKQIANDKLARAIAILSKWKAEIVAERKKKGAKR